MDRMRTIEGPAGVRILRSGSAARTAAIGRSLGALVPAGAVISLEGGLGSGKTVIAGGVCAGLGVDERVLSPSFVLAEEYRGIFPVIHFDLYRLDDPGEADSIGLYDAVDGRTVVIVEWADRLPEESLRSDVRIRMTIRGARSREIRIEAPEALLAALEERLS
jgi:tRNA threonylcarbamoyladenosine biosynthesis protein TsaE